MAKVTSKLQVTLPKALAERYRIRAGDEIDWAAAGDVIKIVPPGQRRPAVDRKARLKLFDQATARQRARHAVRASRKPAGDRGWTREELYVRGRPG
ncbi:MAG TPA: AbrB/MazE/SpoVT family DNA-binding domain-containing protein [Acidobacteriota bacterium]|jgi:bifunctional DNA-binding transcriptional regulator/antitoxin component of YhaV-PrlF toxin-antitoxin module|nr:AbrB/MazE/SpoVT family DNA-binding domain-containing protein [Acidobacteriota bacterium]